MANLKGYVPLPDPGWISIEFDDGTMSNPVHDPTNEYRAQVDEIAKKIKGVPPDPMKDATASLGGAVLGQVADAAGTAVKTATDAAPLGRAAPMMPALTPPAAPVAPAVGGMAPAPSIVKTAMKGGVEQSAEPTAPGAPAPAASAPAPPTPPTSAPLVTTGTSSTWQRNKSQQTSGMADEDKAKVDAANEAAIGVAEESNQADFASKATQYWNEFGRLTEQEKKQVAQRAVLQEQERKADEAISAKYKELDETAARPVDPSQAFAGEKGWYAFMAGFGDVLRNVGAALAGKGPVADPGATLNALVERSVEQQMAQKKADYEQGKLSVDRLNADRETTRHRLGVVLSQLAATELGKAKTQEEYAALGALKAKGDAIVADARAKAAASTARQVVMSDSQVSGGGVTKGPAVRVGGAEGLSKILSTREQLEKSGATPAQLVKFDAEHGLETPKGESELARTRREAGEKRTEAEGKAAAAANGLSRFATGAGLVKDPKTGEWRANSADGAIFNKRQKERFAQMGGLNPTASIELEALADAAIEGFGRQQSGGVIGDEEAVSFKRMITSATTDAQLAERLNSIWGIVEPRLAVRDRGDRRAPESWKGDSQ